MEGCIVPCYQAASGPGDGDGYLYHLGNPDGGKNVPRVLLAFLDCSERMSLHCTTGEKFYLRPGNCQRLPQRVPRLVFAIKPCLECCSTCSSFYPLRKFPKSYFGLHEPTVFFHAHLGVFCIVARESLVEASQSFSRCSEVRPYVYVISLSSGI